MIAKFVDCEILGRVLDKIPDGGGECNIWRKIVRLPEKNIFEFQDLKGSNLDEIKDKELWAYKTGNTSSRKLFSWGEESINDRSTHRRTVGWA